MNTPIWNDYIASFTRPATLAIVPKAATAQPVTDAPAILCAVRLAPRTYYYADGRQETREQWSHREYEFVGYHVHKPVQSDGSPFVGFDSEFVLLRNMHGIFGRKVADVQGLPAMVETKAA